MNSPTQLPPEEGFVCADCRNVFLQPPRCTTCGAEKLYDATVRSQAEKIEHLQELFSRYAEAIDIIADSDFEMKMGEAFKLMRRTAREAREGKTMWWRKPR